MGNPLPAGAPEPASTIALLLCGMCASITRIELGKGKMACPCGGNRRVLRLMENHPENRPLPADGPQVG